MTRATASRKVKSTLDTVIREELEEKKWTYSQFAHTLGVKPGVVSRWLTEDPSKRVVPLPQMCVQIAEVLQLDTVEVFKEAGYLPMDTDARASGSPYDDEIRQLQRQLKRILQSVPATDRRLALIVARGQLQGLQLTLNNLENNG